ncbi:diacylglycerol kinase [Bartonella sp. LJL80]
MQRVFHAFLNSLRALKHLLCHEKAVQQEAVFFVLSIPVALFFARTVGEFIALVGSVLFVMIVEILNTAIEASCNALTRDFRDDIRIAKDAGSLAVLLSIVLALAIWGWIISKTLFFS